MFSFLTRLTFGKKIQYSILMICAVLTIALVFGGSHLMQKAMFSALQEKGTVLANMTADALKNGVQYNVSEFIENPLTQLIAGDPDVSIAAAIVKDGKDALVVKAQKKGKNYESLDANIILDGLKDKGPNKKGEFIYKESSGGFWLIVPIGIVTNDTLKASYLAIMLNTERISKEIESALKWMISIGLIMFFIAFVLGFMISKRLANILKDLAQRISTCAETLETCSHEISGSSQGLSETASEQAAAMNETVSSIHEISITIDKNAENAQIVHKSAEEGIRLAEAGKVTFEEVAQAMLNIDRSTDIIEKEIEKSHKEMAEISKVIADIGSKTAVINDIVFQTKLLSFNASVEAARAGEHGKGFAVVAEEIGNLAQMSGVASKDISSLLQKSIEQVDQSVRSTQERVGALMAEGRRNVEDGSRKAAKSSEMLDTILKSITDSSEMIDMIATASQEQAQGIREIDKVIQELNSTTQQTAKIASEGLTSAQKLGTQSTTLAMVLEQLTETIEGH